MHNVQYTITETMQNQNFCLFWVKFFVLQYNSKHLLWSETHVTYDFTIVRLFDAATD